METPHHSGPAASPSKTNARLLLASLAILVSMAMPAQAFSAARFIDDNEPHIAVEPKDNWVTEFIDDLWEPADPKVPTVPVPDPSVIGKADSCDDNSNAYGDMSCDDWKCVPGNTVSVKVQEGGNHYVRGNAYCGQAWASCDGNGGCRKQGTNIAKVAEEGECEGWTEDGFGARIICTAGTGDPGAVLDVLSENSQASQSLCPELAPAFHEAAMTSVIQKDNGVTTFLWNADTGCAMLNA